VSIRSHAKIASFDAPTAQDNWILEAIALDMRMVPVPAAARLFGLAMLGSFAIARRN